MHRLAFAAVLAAGALAAAAATAQIVTAAPTYDEAKGKLTSTEMQTTFAGKYREEGVDGAGHAWTVVAGADGSLKVVAGEYIDTGRARVDGLQLCVAWQKAWRGAERCFHYAHHGNQLASYGPDGKLDSVLTVSR